MARDLFHLLGLTVAGVLLAAAFVGAMYRNDMQVLKLERLKAESRSKNWAETVEACEAHGGVAVPRATTVLGRSADLPACVPQLGD